MISRSIAEKVELYVLSLWLLFFLVIVVTLNVTLFVGTPQRFIGWSQLAERNVVPIVAVAFLLAGILYFLRFDYRISGSTSIPVSISSIEDMNYEHLVFLTTYIIPLVCIDLASVRYLIALMILLVVIGVIYVKTDKFYANPSLALLGFRLYNATIRKRTGEEVNAVLITKSRLTITSRIQYIKLDEHVFYAKGVQ